MKKISLFLALLGLGMVLSSFINSSGPDGEGAVKWYTWEEAVKANEREKKKFMVDVYTDWCGWCRKMDKATFEQPDVAKYLNENFYPIKLDAEMKEDVNFKGHVFKFFPNAGRKGVHSLAFSLLDEKMSYPSIVFLDENVDRIMISKGFKGPEDFMQELIFTSEEHYKKVNLKTFKGAKGN